jgi:hypothetical protein
MVGTVLLPASTAPPNWTRSDCQVGRLGASFVCQVAGPKFTDIGWLTWAGGHRGLTNGWVEVWVESSRAVNNRRDPSRLRDQFEAILMGGW